MITRKVRSFPARYGRLFVLLPALVIAPSCASSRIARVEDTTVRIAGVCRIHFGHADVNWWLLQGQMSSMDISAEGTAMLANATFRVFEDGNGNGTYDAGERQKAFTSTTSSTGLTVSNISLSAGDVAGWNTDNVSWQVDVTDAAGFVHTTSQHL